MKRTYSVWLMTISGKYMQRWEAGRAFTTRQAATRRGLVAFRVLRDMGQRDFAQGSPGELK